PAGTSPCTSLATGSAGKIVDLRSQRCDGTVGNASWGRIAVTDTDLTPDTGDFQTLVVTVKDAATGAVLKSREMVDSNGLVDLSDISPAAHPALSFGASAVAQSGSEAWNDGNWPKAIISWNADPRDLCFRTTAPVICNTAATIAAINAVLDTGGPATRVTV